MIVQANKSWQQVKQMRNEEIENKIKDLLTFQPRSIHLTKLPKNCSAKGLNPAAVVETTAIADLTPPATPDIRKNAVKQLQLAKEIEDISCHNAALEVAIRTCREPNYRDSLVEK